MRYSVTATLVAILLLAAAAHAQTPAPVPAAPADPAAIARAAQDAAEDLVLTKVLAGLRLTDAQLRELLPLLQSAQTRLQALERENAEAIAKHRPALQEARDQLLAGKTVSTRAETQYAEALKLAETKRKQLRADLVASLKRALAGQLGPQQEALIVQTARSVGFQERTAAYRVDQMTGNRGGGPINWMGRMMDRVRQMPPQDFQRVQGGMGRRFGQGGGNGPMGPQTAQQMGQLMAAIRAMPETTYQQQREALALQTFDQMSRARFAQSLPQDPQAEVDQFLDRYFLSARIVPVVQQRLSAPGGS